MGPRRLIDFADQFKPKFIVAGLPANEEMAREVAANNRQFREFAPVLKTPDLHGAASITSAPERIPIDSSPSGMLVGRARSPTPCARAGPR